MEKEEGILLGLPFVQISTDRQKFSVTKWTFLPVSCFSEIYAPLDLSRISVNVMFHYNQLQTHKHTWIWDPSGGPGPGQHFLACVAYTSVLRHFLLSLRSHVFDEFVTDPYKTSKFIKFGMINWTMEVTFCSFEKYEKLLIFRYIGKKVHCLAFSRARQRILWLIPMM